MFLINQTFASLTALLAHGGQGAPPGGGGGSLLMTFLPFILLIAAFYFLLIAPQKKKQKEHAQMIENIRQGHQVVTSGGIHGIVAAVKKDRFSVRVSEGVKIDFAKNAVQTVLNKDKEPDDKPSSNKDDKTHLPDK